MSLVLKNWKALTGALAALFVSGQTPAFANEYCENELLDSLRQTRQIVYSDMEDVPLIPLVRTASYARNGCADFPEALSLAAEIYLMVGHVYESDLTRARLYDLALETVWMRERAIGPAARDENYSASNSTVKNGIESLLILTERMLPSEVFVLEAGETCPYIIGDQRRVQWEAEGVIAALEHASSSASPIYDYAEHRLTVLTTMCATHGRRMVETRARLHLARARAYEAEGNSDDRRSELRLAASLMNESLGMTSEGMYYRTASNLHQEIQDELAGRN